MVSVQDIRDFLIVDTASQSDEFIQKLIDRTTHQVKDYCNNDFSEGIPLSVEDIIIQWVCVKYDTNTRLKVGKSSQSMGQLSISYNTELPKEFRSILNVHRKVKLL